MSLVRYLTLWPTAACNLDCTYCYRQVRGSETMPEATAVAALELVSSPGVPFHVQLAGGEPTLVPDLVESIVRRVRQAGWPATLALQTNGTHMDVRLARFCRERQVEVGVSLDGPRPTQELLRGRAADTLRALDLLCGERVPVRVTAVLNAVSVPHLRELALLLASFPSVRGLALDPLVSLGSARFHSELVPVSEAIREGVQSLHETVQSLKPIRRTPFRWRELELVRQALAGKTATEYCHACRGESLAVAPDGSVYPCAQAIGDPELSAGTIWEVNWESLKRGFGSGPMQGPCEGCALHHRCPGDCPSRLRWAPRGQQAAACVIYRTLAELESR
ncbi:radical SAM protein [Myxococcota bacterium]